MFSSATQPPRGPPRGPPPRHKRDTCIIHPISRTSSIIDIVVPSKMATGGHFVNNNTKNKKLRIDVKLNIYPRTSYNQDVI